MLSPQVKVSERVDWGLGIGLQPGESTQAVWHWGVNYPGYQSLMRGYMKIAEKDLAWALELARKADVALPVGSLVSQSMARLYNVDDEWRR